MGFTGNFIGSTLQAPNITMENHYRFPSHGGFLIGKISQIHLKQSHVPSVKHTKSELERSTMFNGTIHYSYGHFQ